MTGALLVFLGAGLGGVLRHGLTLLAARSGASFPWGTLAVNVGGCLAMGVLSAWLSTRAGEPWSAPARLFALTGVLGGFTTFSAFSLDAAALWERGEPGLAAAYVGASVLGSLAGVAAGLALARAA